MKMLILMLASLLVFNVQAEVKEKYLNPAVSVTWQNPENYRDIDAGEGNQRHYQQRVLDTLERFLHQELPKALNTGQTIKVVVHDLDLAGDVLPMVIDSRDIRVIKSIYPPMVDIEYVVLASDGSVVKSERTKFRDMGFEFGSSMRHGVGNFAYEKTMLKRWIKKQLKS